MRLKNRKALLLGSGGRESALLRAMNMSDLLDETVCAPGNGGMPETLRRNIKDSDIPAILQLVKDQGFGFVVPGPEGPLAAGIVDKLMEIGVPAFGPTAPAARLEWSKSFGKTICDEAGVPTAAWRSFRDYETARHAIKTWGAETVVKADGLCGGKGVVVPDDQRAAYNAAHDMLVRKKFGDAGSFIVVEDRLYGDECSVMAFCDGEDAELLPPARDFKRALNGNKGDNTGGMGAYSPLPDVSEAMLAQIKADIILPILRCMARRGTPYHGLLYVGLMLTKNGPYVLEFNVRFGDPETEVVIPRVESDVVEYMLATIEPGGLAKLPSLRISPDAAVCTMLTSRGYPGDYKTGLPITGLDEAAKWATILHAGTVQTPHGVLSSGGRVMASVGMAATIEEARQLSLRGAEAVQFENKSFRDDIAAGV